MNADGFIAGGATKGANQRAVVWHEGSFVDLGLLPNGVSAGATAISSAGAVGGTCQTTMGNRPFLYRNGRMENLGTLYPNFPLVSVQAVNQADMVVGYFADSEAIQHRAFRWTPTGGMQDLFGFHSFAKDTNDVGAIVGGAAHNNFLTAYIWLNGDLTWLPFTQLEAINELGDGVGYRQTGALSSGYLYSNGMSRPIDDLLPSGSGWHVFLGIDINDAGQILAYAERTGTGDLGYLLLTPVPEVETWLPVCAGTFLVAFRQLRAKR
jgi:probable HAF family extracellular repeat protein